MAAEPVVLNDCLCFLTRKFGKIAAKPLKSMLLLRFLMLMMMLIILC